MRLFSDERSPFGGASSPKSIVKGQPRVYNGGCSIRNTREARENRP